MTLQATLAWRNIWRNRRRSVITILAVTFAVMLSIAMRGIQLGTYEVNIRHMANLFIGYVQVQQEGFRDNPTLRNSYRSDDSLLASLASDPRVTGVSQRILSDGLASYGDQSQGVMIVAFDPMAEAEASTMMERIQEGRFFRSSDADEIVVGEKLLRNLGASLGDDVVVLAQGYDGSLGNLRFTIVGTVKTGMPEFDRAAIFMGLAAAQDLLVMYGRVHTTVVRLDDLQDIPDIVETLGSILRESGRIALPWNKVSPEFEQAIKLDNVSGILMLAILIAVVAFGITNTVLMSVTERFREFGIMLAVGMPQQRLLNLVMLETTYILLIGLVLGNILAVGINYWLMVSPIEFGGEFQAMYEEYGFLPVIQSTIRLSSFLNTTLSMVLISIAATIYPLVKLGRLEPLKGIRYT